MTDRELMQQALDALENSVDLVREDAYQAEKLYGNYPTRQGKVNGLKVLADDHEKAITALTERLAQPEQEPVAWCCEIEEADFEQDTITLKMLTTDYVIRAGKHWLSTTPPAAQQDQAREIGFDKAELWLKRINAAVLAEREACAAGLEDIAKEAKKISPEGFVWKTIQECAAAIRARSQA
jgi:hypothetical protein